MTAKEIAGREAELEEVRHRTAALIKQTDPVLHDLRVQLGIAQALVQRFDAVTTRRDSQ